MSQAKNLKELKMEDLIGNLLTHEFILKKVNENTKGKKTLVFKKKKNQNQVKKIKMMKRPY